MFCITAIFSETSFRISLSLLAIQEGQIMFKYFHGSVFLLHWSGFRKVRQSSESHDVDNDQDQLTTSDVLGAAVHHDMFTANEPQEEDEEDEVCCLKYR